MAPIAEFTRITVNVGTGENSKTYLIPRNLLNTVPWFKAALQRGGFKEGAEGKISLPEDNPSSFEVFQYGLYTESLGFPRLSENLIAEDLQSELEQCVHAWIFGHKYNILPMQNEVALRICDLLETGVVHFSVELVAICYVGTPSGSPLRVLATESVVHQVREGRVNIAKYNHLSVHEEFLGDLLKAHEACHSAPKDFPRYVKARKFRHLFEVVSDSEEGATASDRGIIYYNTGTYVLSPLDCEDCTTYAAETRCDECWKDDKTDGSWPCAHNSLTRKCEYCAGTTERSTSKGKE
ncbi:hypothetical protein LTR97_001210 [Elasticomyces elasticus]|uniref:BTB domain-containing protein n=1 Tax=Elasticomyces elasticus TaxID=574655 RepID=A0AAN7ZQB5_9PEZI|nr:hypothetical protein LTR97_001210 [Elasticomyces elasticus]KAK5723620.1 hypothetical protein LTR15_005319 [Elasticomyces elasticus]